jgi:hypothetical protein
MPNKFGRGEFKKSGVKWQEILNARLSYRFQPRDAINPHSYKSDRGMVAQ